MKMRGLLGQLSARAAEARALAVEDDTNIIEVLSATACLVMGHGAHRWCPDRDDYETLRVNTGGRVHAGSRSLQWAVAA